MATQAELTVTAPFAGVVVAIPHAPEERVRAGAPVLILEAMKMEHEVLAEAGGVVRRVEVAVGQAVQEGQALLSLAPDSEALAAGDGAAPASREPAGVRSDLRAVRERHAVGLDAARPEAVAGRHEQGRRTARENLADLVDEGTFVEYGPLLFAAQEARRERAELIARTPADGLVAGVGDVEGASAVV